MPKIYESVRQNKINKKYERLLNEVVKPLQDTVINHAASIEKQIGTIDRHVNSTSWIYNNKTSWEDGWTLWKTNIMILAIDLMTRDNIPGAQTFGFTMYHVLILETRNMHICKNNLEVPIILNELGHTYYIGKVRGGKVQVITRFITYRQRQAVYSSKRKLKK